MCVCGDEGVCVWGGDEGVCVCVCVCVGMRVCVCSLTLTEMMY